MLSREWVAVDIQAVAGRVQLNHRAGSAAGVRRSFLSSVLLSFTGKKSNLVNPG